MRMRLALTTMMMLFLIAITGCIACKNAMAQDLGKPKVPLDLDSDPRLDKHITVDAIGVPLNQLGSKLSSGDLEINISPKCANQRLQISFHDRPLRTLCRAIAELMPGYWKPYANGRGYSFYMTDKALAQREEWWRLYMKQHDAALEAQRRYVVERLEEKPDHSASEQISAGQLDHVMNSETFFYGLSHELKTAIADHLVDTLLYRASGLAFSDGGMEEGGVSAKLSEIPEVSRQAVRKEFGKIFTLQQISEESIGLNIVNEGRFLSLHFDLPDGKETQASFSFTVHPAPNAAPLGLMHQTLVAVVKKLGGQAPPDWKRLTAYQERRVWPNDPPKDRSLMKVMSAFGPPRQAECLEWLKDKAHIEFVSDYYDRGCSTLSVVEKEKSPTEPLKVELDSLAAEQDVSWKKGQDGIYLFRNNRWYRDDALQVPVAKLQRWTTELVAIPPLKANAPTFSDPHSLKARMDLEAQIVTELTPFQISNGLEWAAVDVHSKTSPPHTVFPFAGFADRILHERYTALFYSCLTDLERTALLEGHLVFSELNSDQRRQAVFLKPSLLTQTSDGPIWLTLKEMPKRSWSVTLPGGSVRGIRLEVVGPPSNTP